MNESQTTIQGLVKRCGGAAAITAKAESDLTHWAVYKWYKNGIPEDRWHLVMSLSGATVTEIYAANQSAKRERVSDVVA